MGKNPTLEHKESPVSIENTGLLIGSGRRIRIMGETKNAVIPGKMQNGKAL